ncbi:MAG TPA: hypothetical protein VLR46_12520 [Candidatus Dormibacteraeota bacterium]|nr:hypothetical protein [Candidatus Dormibacteraeota bacterium]
MGASSAEIDRQIKETRQQLDANLSVLEQRAAARARLARVAVAAGAGLAAVVGAGLVIYAMRRRRSPAARIHDAIPGRVRRLPSAVARKLKRSHPAAKVVVADPDEASASRAWESIAQKVVATMAVSAAGQLASRLVEPPDAKRDYTSR